MVFLRKVILSIVLLFIINSCAMAAHQISDFPLGMSKVEAIAKGLVMKDQFGGLIDIRFGSKEWPTALVFEDEKLVYLMLNGKGNDYVAAAEDGLWQLGWLAVYATTDNNLTFDAVNLAASGMDEMAIGEEYEKFHQIMQSQKYANCASMYISDRVWSTIKQLKAEKPADKYPDAAICNVTIKNNEALIIFSTFGYIKKMNRE